MTSLELKDSPNEAWTYSGHRLYFAMFKLWRSRFFIHVPMCVGYLHEMLVGIDYGGSLFRTFVGFNQHKVTNVHW